MHYEINMSKYFLNLLDKHFNWGTIHLENFLIGIQ